MRVRPPVRIGVIASGIIGLATAGTLIALLRNGPLPIPEILKELKVLHVGQLNARELLRQEVIGKAGLTPTDLMHVEGSYQVWDREAAALALEIFAHYRQHQPADVQRRIWDRITEMALHAILTFLTDKRLPAPGDVEADHDDSIGPWFFHNSLYQAHPHLETRFRLRRPIIGIGAPASFFLGPVAHALNTELVLPQYHQVANAVGAVGGMVMVTEEILVYPMLDSGGVEVMGYYAQTGEERFEFTDLNEALQYADTLCQERALGGALRSGADNPQVVVERLDDGLDTYRIRAKAVGNPRLTR